MRVNDLFSVDPWPHQLAAVEKCVDFIDSKESAEGLCITSPTGGGKSFMFMALIRWCIKEKMTVGLVTHRTLLYEQIASGLEKEGIPFMPIASGRDGGYGIANVYLMMIQTARSRHGKGQWNDDWRFDVLLVDEAHVVGSAGTAEEALIKEHLSRGAIRIGFTATPLGVSHMYKNLFTAGTKSSLRNCKSLTWAEIAACGELDTSQVKKECVGEDYSSGQLKLIWNQAIVSNVFDAWKQFNPDARLAMGFSPGVPESMALAREFHDRGVEACAIDSKGAWARGERWDGKSARDDVLNEWRSGGFQGPMFNRFVLREGFDEKKLWHLILACPIGSLLSMQQVYGRVLRWSAETPNGVMVTDHGGNWYRHPGPNDDIPWDLYYNEDPSLLSKERREQLSTSDPDERAKYTPLMCAKCKKMYKPAAACPHCGHVASPVYREVIQKDGTLKRVKGVSKVRRPRTKETTVSIWKQCYRRIEKKRSGCGTFSQARGLFIYENGYCPPHDLPLMPRNAKDWVHKIDSVNKKDLY